MDGTEHWLKSYETGWCTLPARRSMFRVEFWRCKKTCGIGGKSWSFAVIGRSNSWVACGVGSYVWTMRPLVVAMVI